MSKFTSGKWEVCRAGTGSSDGGFVIDEYFVRRDSDNIAIAADISDPKTGKPSEANARLISAAPDLLRALKEVFVIGDRLVSDVYGHEFVESARAAIAKATGKQA